MVRSCGSSNVLDKVRWHYDPDDVQCTRFHTTFVPFLNGRPHIHDKHIRPKHGSVELVDHPSGPKSREAAAGVAAWGAKGAETSRLASSLEDLLRRRP